MITIHMYELLRADCQILYLPKGAAILSAQVQRGAVCLWAKVDTEKTYTLRTIRIHGTGHPIGKESLRFIDTVQMHEGSNIFHIFEETS